MLRKIINNLIVLDSKNCFKFFSLKTEKVFFFFTAYLNYQQKYWRKSAEQKPGL